MVRLLLALALAGAGLLASAAAVLACEPYTFDDTGFRLERGIAWAFRGHVVREVIGETGRPTTVVIAVDRTLAGTASGRELSIRQDDGCDGFWYHTGDSVVVAVPRYPGFAGDPVAADRLRPPYERLTNYVVAVWVLDGERVVPGMGPHSWPAIDGTSPATLGVLVSALAALPDTASAGPATLSPTGTWLVPGAAGVLSFLAALAAGAERRGRSARQASARHSDAHMGASAAIRRSLVARSRHTARVPRDLAPEPGPDRAGRAGVPSRVAQAGGAGRWREGARSWRGRRRPLSPPGIRAPLGRAHGRLRRDPAQPGGEIAPYRPGPARSGA
jgi:hypothetical protein